ncbi:hypothetical protein A3J90_06965 [candidate division WOR-1 bacterium RIFOXYC2_FULL_37_10]|uniref:UDP-N-acetylglucosamine 2-epimerase domain-containing protein n=1 Tax=candidate division WOR-1 bacterium RIFOXYB2_FULL_37_13 TaxID=1802579 RepID=A0A1F4SQ70_UNCSA|nr:MAG: hypothetical protein A2310_07530 [candidate division WOR-1 bacterium RIFOXYB2_FULL_37_13]OGC34224.1 MAG: hypothetical protein A3J90_06965 [candidate division WOR-1 bacterium RIFOXYC2_FULL_37_10]
MKNFYLIDYLKENYPIDKELLDALKWQLDGRIYHYGYQFKGPSEECKNEPKIETIKENLKDILRYCKGLFKAYPVNDKPKLLSFAYFTYNDELENIGFNVFLPPWIRQFVRGYPPKHIKKIINYLKSFLMAKNFNEIIGPEFLNKIIEAEEILKRFYIKNDFKALCVHADMPFFENWNIKIFRKMNRPSFILLHGLTQHYENINDNRSNYLVVWGEKIKENYINAGVDSKKVFVSGHPYYKEFNLKDLKFDLGNILVLGYPSISWHCDSMGVNLFDRGISILYLYSIQKTLEKLGVKYVTLKLHPSENTEWYKGYIDNDFYKIEIKPLKNLFNQSSLVIGNSSTSILESIYCGINYIVYEPSVNDYAWGSKYRLVNPFDGSDSRVPVAKNEAELLYILKNKIKIDSSVFNDYIKTPFDISFMKKLILKD